MQALEILEDQLVGDQRNLKLVDDYEALNVSQK